MFQLSMAPAFHAVLPCSSTAEGLPEDLQRLRVGQRTRQLVFACGARVTVRVYVVE